MLSSILSSIFFGQSSPPKFNITVVHNGKRTTVTEVEKPQETVAQFKHRVAEKIGIPARQQALIVNDRYVANDILWLNAYLNFHQ